MTYGLYKPLRNHLRKYSLIQSLAVIRAYAQHLQFGQPFPQDVQVPLAFLAADLPNKNVYEWELELLTREVIINCSESAEYDMRRYSEFASAVNKLKRLENDISGCTEYREMFRVNVLQEVFRIAHRQFQWQKKPCTDDFMRYYKIFGRPELDAIIVATLGINARQIFSVGLGLTGMYLENFGLRLPITVDLNGLITNDQVQQIVNRFSIDIDELRTQMSDAQSYDQDFAYTMNPLLIRPLIRVDQDGVPVLIAPIPTYILRRFTDGIYYEIYDAAGFSDAFGASFQAYIGDVLQPLTQGGNFTIYPEEPYHVGRELKHSIDWIATDGTATLFVECKTKRLRYAGKVTLTGNQSLDGDLAKMADFVVQNYKTLSDALAGRYVHWQPDGHPIYPVIITLEEWFTFDHRTTRKIDEQVRIRLVEAGLDVEMIERYPYSICSAKDFEYSSYAMSRVGIDRYMAQKSDAEHRYWNHSVFTGRYFHNEAAQRPDIFSGAWEELVPGL